MNDNIDGWLECAYEQRTEGPDDPEFDTIYDDEDE
jgi:hypothetical protein